MAERGRFELPVSCDTHPFQGCALGHYATSPSIICYKNGIGGDTRRSKPSILRYAPFPKVGTTATMRPLRKIYLVALFPKNGYMNYMENSQKIKKNVVPIPRVAKIFSYLIPTTFSIY